MSEIQTYVEKLKMKKVLLGGFDKEIVYSSMQEMFLMYQKELADIKEEKEQLEKELKEALEKLEQKTGEVQLLLQEKEEKKSTLNNYDTKFNTLIQAVDVINESKESIIGEARRKAEEVLEEANKKYLKINQECMIQKQKKELFEKKTEELKASFSNSLEDFHIKLSSIIYKIDELRNNGFEFDDKESVEKTIYEKDQSIIDSNSRFV